MACGDQSYSGCSCAQDLAYHPQQDPCTYLDAIAKQLELLNKNIEKLLQKKDWSGKVSVPIEMSLTAEVKGFFKQLLQK